MSQSIVSTSTFCVLPWMHVATNSAGHFRVCCHALPGLNQIRDESGRAMRIDKDSIETVWKAPTYQKIRRQMLKGEEPEMCRRCFREEDAGVVSFRQSSNTRYMKKILPTVDENGTAPFKVLYVDLRLGNLCNLRCRMCNPYASNQWIKEWNQIADKPLSELESNSLSKMTWPENPQVWEQMETVLGSVEEIYLTGGEPLIIKQQMTLLENCVSRGLAGNIILKYNTNMTHVPDRMIALWSKFKRVKINCSIDGVGELNDYIRYPSTWRIIDKNLRTMVDLSKQFQFRLQVHTTVQAYNILELPELFSYLEELSLFPYLNILDRPEYLNVRILSQDLKEEAILGLQPFIDRPKVSGLIHYLSEDWTHLKPQFQTFTNSLDQSRGQSLKKLSPRLGAALLA